MIRYDDVSEGDEIPTLERPLTKDEVRAYARAARVFRA